MIFLVVALVDSKMLTNNIVLQKCTFNRFTGKPDVYVQNRIPSICALTTCQKMLRSYSTLSGLALMTQDSSREGRGLHRDSLKSSHMARAWSQILQLVCVTTQLHANFINWQTCTFQRLYCGCRERVDNAIS